MIKSKIFIFSLAIFLFSLSFVSAGFLAVNTSTYYLHNESDSQYTNYLEMLNMSTDLVHYVNSTPAPFTTNNVITCYNYSWIAPNYSLTTQVNGTWNFSIYSNCSSTFSNVQYFLFAKILVVQLNIRRSE